MTEKLKIVIAADHAGYKLKSALVTYFKQNEKYIIKDLGTFSSESVDYPEYGHKIAYEIESGNALYGITICGSGNGMNMTTNKHQGIRSALCWNEEISRLARAHNDANICSLPGRFMNIEQAIVIVTKFISTAFDGGRHERRIRNIPIRNEG